jgi:hypothetical protein
MDYGSGAICPDARTSDSNGVVTNGELPAWLLFCIRAMAVVHICYRVGF